MDSACYLGILGAPFFFGVSNDSQVVDDLDKRAVSLDFHNNPGRFFLREAVVYARVPPELPSFGVFTIPLFLAVQFTDLIFGQSPGNFL